MGVLLIVDLGIHSGSFAIISKRVGLERVLLSIEGGGDIGFKSPAVSAELNLLKDDGNASWVLFGIGVPPPLP